MHGLVARRDAAAVFGAELRRRFATAARHRSRPPIIQSGPHTADEPCGRRVRGFERAASYPERMRIAPVIGVFVFTSPFRETSPTLFQNDFEIKRRKSEVRRRLQLTRIIGSDLPRNGRDAAPPVELSRFSDEFVRRVSPVCRWFPPSCSGRNELPDNPQHFDYNTRGRVAAGEMEGCCRPKAVQWCNVWQCCHSPSHACNLAVRPSRSVERSTKRFPIFRTITRNCALSNRLHWQ